MHPPGRNLTCKALLFNQIFIDQNSGDRQIFDTYFAILGGPFLTLISGPFCVRIDNLKTVFHELAEQRGSKILSGNMVQDHVHMLISIPSKYSVAEVVRVSEG